MQKFALPHLEIITPEVVKKPLYLSFLATLLIIIISGVYYVFSQPEIPLLYTLARPNQALVSKEWLFLLPSISFVLSVLHVFIIHWLRELEPILLSTFVGAGLLLQVVLLADIVRIVYITL
jgi:hypothetical protein